MRDPRLDDSETTTHFGYQEVPVTEKTARVRGVFNNVARNYDLMNDLMSAGVHRLWKAAFVERLDPRPGMRVLDVAGGTGDIAFRIHDRTAGAAEVTICDINAEMLGVGRERAIDRGILAGPGGIDWVCGDAEALPFEDGSMDAYTIAFGLRNVTRIGRALEEARRVLRPGGRFLCLEFSRVALPGLDTLYDRYSFSMLPLLGRYVARDEAAYRYLAESIRQFPPQQALARMIEEAGMDKVRVQNLSGGIAAIHTAWRL